MRVGQRARGGAGARLRRLGCLPPSLRGRFMAAFLHADPPRKASCSARFILPPRTTLRPSFTLRGSWLALLHCGFLYYWVFLALLYRCIIRGMVFFFLLCVSCAALRLDRIQGVWRVEGGLGDASNLVCFFFFFLAFCQRRRPLGRREFLAVLCTCAC